MTQAYIVAGSNSDLAILQALIPVAATGDVVFAEGGSKYGIYSLANSLLSARQKPVAIIINADTEDAPSIHEQRESLRDLLKRAAVGCPFAIFIAVPELEAVFFQSKTLIEQLTKRPLSEVEWALAQHFPIRFLNTLPGGHQRAVEQILANLTDDQRAQLQKADLVKNITQFLLESTVEMSVG